MTKAFAILLVIVAAVFIAPLITIWALNTLFGLGIAFTVTNWLAICWLQTVTFGGMNYRASKTMRK